MSSVQIATNDLVKEGEWIEVPSFDADGDVDWIDFGKLISNWLRRDTGYYPVKGNLNDDNQVDFFDFAIFSSTACAVEQ